MRLLFVTSLVPCGTPSTGYEIANEAIINGLRRTGADVKVIGFTWPGKAPSDPENTIHLGEVDVRTEGASTSAKMRWVASALAGGFTISSVKMRIIGEQVLRRSIAAHGPFDAYVLNGVSLPGAFTSVFNDLPSLWIAHNVEHLSSLENARTADSALKRTLFRRDAKILKDLEQTLAARSRHVFTLAEEDRAPLGVAHADRSTVLPLVTSETAGQTNLLRKPVWDAGLIGTWTWQPNRIGLEWFLKDVAPLLPEGMKVALAGSLPSGLAEAPPCVTMLGRVPDAKEFVNSCAVIPLVAVGGTGVQLKTIETFEAGLPSVATTLSLRGIGSKPGNCVVADEPAAFAQALVRQVAGVKSGLVRDADGSAFLASQRASLDEALRRGLDFLHPSNGRAAA